MMIVYLPAILPIVLMLGYDTMTAMACVMVLGTVAAAAGVEKTITVTPMGLTVNGYAVTPTTSGGPKPG